MQFELHYTNEMNRLQGLMLMSLVLGLLSV